MIMMTTIERVPGHSSSGTQTHIHSGLCVCRMEAGRAIEARKTNKCKRWQAFQ